MLRKSALRKRRGDVVLRGFASRCGGCGSAGEEISFLVVLEEGGDGVGSHANLPRVYELSREERILSSL